MTFTFHTAKNHKQYVATAIAKAQHELEELDKHERNLRRPDGFPRYSPPEEQEQRLLIEAERMTVLAERDQVIRDAREVAEQGRKDSAAGIKRIDALQAAPIRRLTAADAANVRALVELLEAGFNRSSFSDMLEHVAAAAADSNRDQQIACYEVLQRRIATIDRPGPQRDQLEAAAGTLLKKLHDPALAREREEHAEGLKNAEDLLAAVRAQDHPIRVLEAQEALVATGLYGDRIAGPTVLRNMNETPIHEMVEQA